MKILLAIDHSKYSEAALQALIRQIRPQDTEVTVLHIMEVSLADFESRAVFEAARDARLQQANELVERFAKKLREEGYASKPMVAEGDARDSIIDFAEKWKPEVIFVGSHGRRRFRRLSLGRVSEAVARHAGCSVEIVRSHEGD
jgi:nucleotide-binding universal stress UspA family protein